MKNRDARDVIDDIMVELDLLESELAIISKEEKHKGRMLNVLLHIESIRSLLIELKLITENVG